MEKAILKTLIYADIFDYPLKINEIHKWLIGKKVTIRQVEKALNKLVQSSKCKAQSGYYFLPNSNALVAMRKRKEKQSGVYFRKAKIISQILKLIPWIKLVGISGGLALNNASRKDDVDLFFVTDKNRLWISRLLALGLISLTGQRRAAGATGREIAGKFCLNLLLEEDRLEQASKDVFVAHEVLQMKVLWQRGGIYSKFLSDNDWVFKFLPNWIGDARGPGVLSLRAPHRMVRGRGNLQQTGKIASSLSLLAMTMEGIAKWLQLKIMKKPQGMERIEDGALYFHPEDCRTKILSEYRRRIQKFSTP